MQEGDSLTEEFDEAHLITTLQAGYDWSDVDLSLIASTSKPVGESLYSAKCSEQYRKWYGYFNALTTRKEKSKRLFDLTKLLLAICSSNYYALMARLDCFRQLQPSLEEEVKLINQLLRDNSKEYHLWNYRKILKPEERIDEELSFVDELLEDDNKHYHAWSYRVWLMGRAPAQKQEQDLASIDARLRENWLKLNECYSAWSYRRFLQARLGLLAQLGFIQAEVKHLLGLLASQPANECIWNTLNALFQHNDFGVRQIATLDVKYIEFPSVLNVCLNIENRFSLHTQLQIAREAGDREEVSALLNKLTQQDPTRELYWQYLQQN